MAGPGAEIAAAQQRGQPVLVGTVSVEKSELLATLLRKRNIPHEILNAKNHSREATIIAEAGHKGNVMISTNMAGRGTDIVLGPGVVDLGGLYVIGTERHESRRIDNQLRGRSGRQGDPGRSKFYLSLEDDLMRIFASDRLSAVMGRLGMQEGEAIVSPMVTRAIERAQKRVEEQNFSSRKHVLEYDDVMNQQRQVVYSRRLNILKGTTSIDFIYDSIADVASTIAAKFSPDSNEKNSWDVEGLKTEINAEFNFKVNFDGLPWTELGMAGLVNHITDQVFESYNEKKNKVGSELMNRVEAYIYLQIIDQAWKEHLRNMEQIQDNVRLRGYGQRDPLQEYKKEAYKAFETLMMRIEDETALALIRMPPPEFAPEELSVEEPDETNLNFSHPEAISGYSAPHQQPDANSPSPESDGLIYHGHREVSAQQKVETFVRQGEKVGRNDLCPCGSGKKYKKCHGKHETENLA